MDSSRALEVTYCGSLSQQPLPSQHWSPDAMGLSKLGSSLPGAGGAQGSWSLCPQHLSETLSLLPTNTAWKKRQVFPVITSEYNTGSKMYLCSHRNLQTRQTLFNGGSFLNCFCNSSSRSRSSSFSFGFATGENLSSRGKKKMEQEWQWFPSMSQLYSEAAKMPFLF